MTATTADQGSHGVHAPAPARGPARRHLLGPGWIRAAWMTALLFGFGFGLVVVLRWWGGWHPLLDWQPLILVSALVAAPLGFLGGLGAFDYWVYYALGHPTRAEDHSTHGARSWKDYFRVNTDHKVIGIQYITTTFAFFILGGLMAMLFRAELAKTGSQ